MFRRMLSLGAALFVVATATTGCETLQLATSTVPTTTMAKMEDAAYKAKIAFQASLIIAVEYIETPRCGFPTSPRICSEQSVVDLMRRGITMADAATQAAEDAVRKLGSNPTLVAAVVTGAEEAVKAFKVIAATRKTGA